MIIDVYSVNLLKDVKHKYCDCLVSPIGLPFAVQLFELIFFFFKSCMTVLKHFCG